MGLEKGVFPIGFDRIRAVNLYNTSYRPSNSKPKKISLSEKKVLLKTSRSQYLAKSVHDNEASSPKYKHMERNSQVEK